MRFKQFQRYQNVRTHYRLYKSGRKWCVALVMLIGGSTLGLTLSTRPIQAATTPTVTTTATTSTSQSTASAPSADSMGSTLSANSAATSTVAITSSTSPTSVAPTSAAISTMPTSTATSTTASTAPTSVASLATNSTGQTTKAVTSAASDQLMLVPETASAQYTPTKETRTIKYWDTTTNQLLTQTRLSGAYQSVPANPTLAMIQDYQADGYRLVSTDFPETGSPFASPALTGTYIVKLAEQFVTVTPTTPDNAGLDLTKTVTRKVAFESANGQTLAPSVLETVTFERTARVDEATGNVEYSAWHAYGPASFNAIKVPSVSNYQPNVSQLAAIPITVDSPNVTKVIRYRQVAPQNATQPTSQMLTDQTSTQTQLARAAKLSSAYENLHTPVIGSRQQIRTAKWQQVLPQTSEQSQNPIWGGLLSLIMLSGLASYRRRKHD